MCGKCVTQEMQWDHLTKKGGESAAKQILMQNLPYITPQKRKKHVLNMSFLFPKCIFAFTMENTTEKSPSILSRY